MGWADGVKRVVDVTRALAERAEVERRERWDRARLETHQQTGLAELVAYARERSPFYRNLYRGTRGDRLESLPSVTKAEMMQNFDAFVTDPRLRRQAVEEHLAGLGTRDELYLGQFRVMASSGSSGQRGIYVFDRQAWRHVLGGMLRSARMMGMQPRLPRRRRVALISAPDAKHMTYRFNSSADVGVLDTLCLRATQPIDELVAALNRFQPEGMHAYPSVAAMLALEQLEGRLRIAPTSVSTSSEVRTEEMTGRIRAAWKLEPFNNYGLTEAGIAALDCAEHRGLHIFEDYYILEVVDEHNRPVPRGERGDRVLLTNLFNRSQPFIRFEITDLLSVSDEPCPCGRSFRRILAIEGRSDDVLALPSAGGGSTRVHPIHLRSPLAKIKAISSYQIVHSKDRLDVLVVPASGAAREALGVEVERALRAALAALGVDVPVHVRAVDAIEREPGAGKFKLVKSA